MKSIKKTVNLVEMRQKIFSFTIAYMVSFLGLLNCINAITNELGFNTPIDTIFCYGVLILSIIAGGMAIIAEGYIKKDVLLFMVVVLAIYMITFAFYPHNREYLFTEVVDIMGNPFYMVVIYSVPGYVFVRHLRIYEFLKKYLFLFSYLVVGLSSIVYFFIPDSDASQYMTLSYNMLLQVCFLMMYIPEKGKITHYAFIVIGWFVVAFGGSRGALAGLVIGLALILLFKEYSRKKKILLFSIIGIFLILAIIFYEEILFFIETWLNVQGLESRTFELLFRSDGDFSSGRFGIQSYLLKKWTILGEGIYGDRILLKTSFLFNETESYAHNLFVEWIVDFGVFGGTVLICGFIFLLIKAVINVKTEIRYYVIVLIPSGLIHLLLSGSYLNQSPSFYVLLGLCVSSFIQGRKEKRYECIANQYRVQSREYRENCL